MTAVEEHLSGDETTHSHADVAGDEIPTKEHVTDLFLSGQVTTYEALQLAAYVTHGAEASVQERQARMARMTRILESAQPGTVALVHSLNNFVGGQIDGPMGLAVHDDYRFIMEVPFAQMPDDPRIARVHIPHMLIGSRSNNLVPGDYVYIGHDEIAAFTRAKAEAAHKTQGFATLTGNRGQYHLKIERDGMFLTGLYQAGMTLAECGVDDETRNGLRAVYQEVEGTRMAEFYCPAVTQVLHVITMDTLT